MAALQCEICGNSDFIKQDGVFVCQNCGCKYSVEEAKKMMVGGTAEVQGIVKVANTPQLNNLLKMAHNAYDSQNYAKAEDFCDQVIAMDDTNYDAWKLKGEAINYQINANNPRILEVYNCIMMSYNVLDDAQKESHKNEILSSLKTCFEGEVDFWLKQIEAQRPTSGAIKKAEDSFIDSWNKMQEAFEILGLEESKDAYLRNFDNYFIVRAEINAVSCWNSTVAYNYYRGKYSNGRWINDEYRPSDEILTTFIQEVDNLIELMRFCIKQINESTKLEDQKAAYANISFFHKEASKGQSWTRMVSTTTNGYGATLSKREYWQSSKSLTDEAKQSRRKEIAECDAKVSELERRIKERDAAEKVEKAQKYWNEHKEEKQKLESEKSKLMAHIDKYNEEIMNVPGATEIKTIQAHIDTLQHKKSSLGLFKISEKKVIQEQIDAESEKLKSITDKMNAAKAEIFETIEAIKNRINDIDTELNTAK